MGLFFNRKNELKIYEGNNIDNHNQEVFRTDTVSTALEEQQKAFDKMNEKYGVLEKQLRNQKRIQSERWKTTDYRFDEILENQSQHHHFEREAMETLERLDNQNKELQSALEKKRKKNEELVQQINQLSQSNSEIAEQLKKFDVDQEMLLRKMDEQLDRQQQFSISLEEQKSTQEKIVDRIEQQEGLVDKLMRQMDFLKSVLFERTHFIAEKIDKSFSYISERKAGSK
ncbi:hypothetical protein QTL97_03180 [Sporosarcina thermotolerans]|uniref:Uncharacterized protein n=2 Tax=Sporosarcina thermotolerans TaxID=633404 RepID=A0AAW9A518_9BACL|nr:hypothetical protein [Sporosarcina thermotolerans]MDW0115944.1 hypothetical protein [Sporosarcina thermotolerans]